jgi:hypothetical protein
MLFVSGSATAVESAANRRFGFGPHPDIKITGCPGMTMRRDGIGADDQKINVDREECGQHAFEVWVEQCSAP